MWQVSRDRKYPGMWVVGIWLGLSQESELRTAFLVWGWCDNWEHGIWSLPQGTPDGGGLVFCSKEFRLQWGELGVLIRQSTETWGTRSWTWASGAGLQGQFAPGIDEWKRKRLKQCESRKFWSGNKSVWGSPSGEMFTTETLKPQPWWEQESGDQEGLLGTRDTRICRGFGGNCS